MESLGEYRIVRQVGEGGMGKVFEAEERLTGRRVALKVLRPELARSEPGRRLFANEMAILARLDHPNVVRCLACSEIDGELVMALELLDGRTLRDVLAAEGALAWPQAVDIVLQMARALSAAHEHEPVIVHRDLKPENVMLGADGAVKVMDFGVAKMFAALGSASTHSVGTLAYMSPEQIDAGPIDARSDLYALGLVFYELIAGRPPFESSSPRELLNLQCTAEPPPFAASIRRELPRGVG
jgi:serine/threonine protein kinase